MAAVHTRSRFETGMPKGSALSRVGGSNFIRMLAQEALRHRAVRHPYLTALASGSFRDTGWAIADFARQYYGYSLHFPRYLMTVMSRLEDPVHRSALLVNLNEESGSYSDEELQTLAQAGIETDWVRGVPHTHLFRLFSESVGVSFADLVEADQVRCWREMFLQVLANGHPAEAVGALGLGTENIVRTIYQNFVSAIKAVGTISPRDSVFFALHTTVDDHHQATLAKIAESFATTEDGRMGLRKGMIKALTLRASFWDWLHERALDPDRAEEVI
jgi:pyrroloquinoline quinone (PQQ) biosynthesis protein C